MRLRYAATTRCPCGAGVAYDADTTDLHGSWECSAILRGKAVHARSDGEVKHIEGFPFSFYEIKSEDQPSAGGATTRPEDDPKQPEAPKPLIKRSTSVRCATCGAVWFRLPDGCLSLVPGEPLNPCCDQRPVVPCCKETLPVPRPDFDGPRSPPTPPEGAPHA